MNNRYNVGDIIEDNYPAEERIKAITDMAKTVEDPQKDTVRLKAHDMLNKLTGDYAPEKSVNLNKETALTPEEEQAIKELEEEFK